MALAFAACSQSVEPEAELEPVSPVVEKTPSAKVDKKSSRPSASGKKTAPATPAPRAGEPATPALPAATPSPEPVVEPPPAAFPAAQVAFPFVPSAPGKRISHVSVPGPYVAVTFDDGPHAALTPQVLDIFNRHGAHATFFVLGRNASRNRSILARAVAEGHEVGAHTWSHINMRASSTSTIRSELDRTNSVIEEATGQAPRVMRPPYGSVNKPLIDMVYNRYGTPAILWDVDTNDWRKPGVQTVINRAVGNARPGSIILLHDIHSSTIAAVEGVVTGLQARGFKLVTVSELIAMGRQAAGAAAPAREQEVAPAAETPQPAPAEPEAAVVASPLHAQQQQQVLPEGAADMGTAPQPVAEPEQPAARPVEADFEFYES